MVVSFGRRLVPGAVLLAVAAAAPAASADDGELTVDVAGDRGPPVAVRDPSGASYVIKGERLRVPGASSADALAEVPGVQVSRSGASCDYATASVRGATSAETPVYLAGVRINDDVTGTADLSLVPLWMIQRVEVYRSGAPFEADRLGPGGAVFFEPVLPRGARAGGGLGLGSFGEQSAWVSGTVGGPRAGAVVALRRESATNNYPYLDDRGTTFVATDDVQRRRANADYSSYDLWNIGRLQIGRGVVTSLVNVISREQGAPGLGVVPALHARASAQRFLGALKAEVPCAAGDRCALEVSTAALLSATRLDNPTGKELDLAARFVANSGARVAESARVRYRFADVLTLGMGASQEFEQLRIDQPEDPTLRAHRGTSRGSVSAVVQVAHALELNAVGAVESHSTRGAGPTFAAPLSAVEPTVRAGARLSLGSGMSVVANVGRYARLPTLGELYGTSSVAQGNPLLVPEHGMVVDAGLRASHSQEGFVLYADVFGFARVASDLIGFRRTSQGTVAPYNIGNARIVGVEAALGARIVGHVRAEVSLTALDPRDTTAGRTLANNLIPFRSRLVAVPFIEVYTGPMPSIALARASLGARLSYRASYAYDPAGLSVGAEQANVDVELGLSFAGGTVAARVAVTDVTDAARRDLVGFPIPGRGGQGTLEIWW